MIILTIRTDKPEAELGLYKDSKKLSYQKWQAHRELSDTVHRKIEELLKSSDKTWADIGGIVAFQGPGSFTGLRIGLTVANTLAYSLDCPIVGSDGDKWIETGIIELESGKNVQQVMPEYGSEPNITQQKK